MITGNEFWHLAEGVWRLDLPGGGEVIVGGDARAPDSNRLELAQRVLPRLDDVVAKACDYLNSFVNVKLLKSTGEWDFLSVECGRSVQEPLDEFAILLELESDTYGLWAVRFRDGPAGFWPIFFSRRQV